MAQNPLIKRYLDAGMAFTAMTQSRAEAIVKDLVKTGEVQAQRGEELVNQIVVRSRKNSEKLLDAVRQEVKNQVSSLGLATKDDVARLEKKLADATAEATAAKKAAQAASKATKASKSTKSTRASSTKRAAKKSTKKASPARKSTGTRSRSSSSKKSS